jgi:branched-chain amino acid transport system ATP-binding protein
MRDVVGDSDTLQLIYLGLTEVGKKSYRDVKHYKRRKRWLT